MTSQINEILYQIRACNDLSELNQLWSQYKHIPELKEAILNKCSYILATLDD